MHKADAAQASSILRDPLPPCSLSKSTWIFAGDIQLVKVILQLLVNMAAASYACLDQIWDDCFPATLAGLGKMICGKTCGNRSNLHTDPYTKVWCSACIHTYATCACDPGQGLYTFNAVILQSCINL